MLIFLVIQGRTPKNKESVSSKILLNHVQMLALLSGIFPPLRIRNPHAAVGAAWTDPFLGLLTVGGVGTLVDSRIVTTDCAIRVSFYYKFAGYIAIPVVTVIVSGLVHLVIFLIKGVIIPFFHAHGNFRVFGGNLYSVEIGSEKNVDVAVCVVVDCDYVHHVSSYVY
jgi:hypothetical protein